ncbi:MAG: hypothetical protein GY793_00485 [Proteobacteria bacterium]|nr:hypothetical protein [Pseudomonadota bacterium]
MRFIKFDIIKNFYSLTKHETKKLITDKSTWIIVAIFVAILNTSAFFMGGFLILNEANMASFLKFAPFVITIFALLISFSKNLKDYKQSNFVKTASLPINFKVLTLAKFTANNIIGLVFLILSSSFIATLYYVGTPDTLLILSGLFACVLMLKLSFAVTSFTNNISKTGFESFAYSVLIFFVIFLAGLGGLTSILASFLPEAAIMGLQKYSIIGSFYSIGSGLIGLHDLVLFISLIAMFLIASMVYANKGIYKLKFARITLALLLVVTMMINSFFYESIVKFDLTSDKLYSISENLQQIVKKLGKQKLQITFYYSESNKSKPIQYAKFATYIDKYLRQLQSENKYQIIYKKLDPETDENIEVQALRDRIAEIPLPGGDSMYAGIALRRYNVSESIPHISMARKNFFEYDLASLISNFSTTNKSKRIGIVTDLDLGQAEQRPAFMLELLKRYEIDIIPVGYPVFPNYDLIITFVTPFTEAETIYGIDQYLVKGGKVLVFLDPLFRTAPEKDFLLPDRKADDKAFDHIADLLRFYGVEYDYNSILGDKSRAMSTNLSGIGITSYPLWVMFSEREMNKEHPVFANLANIVIPEGGFFSKTEILPSLEYTPLLKSSPNSQIISRGLFNTIGDPKAVASRLRGEKKVRDVSFMLNGHFLSAFKEMPASVKDWFDDADSIKGTAKFPKHTNTSKQKGALIAIADMDFMSDQFSTYAKKELDGSMTKTPISDNQSFLTNLIDYMMAETDLISLRGKGFGLRKLTKVEDLLIKDIIRKDFQENALVRNIELVIKQYETLNKRLQVAKTQEQLVQLRQLISEKQKDIVISKRKLKVYKRSLKETVENYARKLALFNILFAPLLLTILGFIYFTRRYLLARNKK